MYNCLLYLHGEDLNFQMRSSCVSQCDDEVQHKKRNAISPTRKRKNPFKKLFSTVPDVLKHFNIVRQVGSGMFIVNVKLHLIHGACVYVLLAV